MYFRSRFPPPLQLGTHLEYARARKVEAVQQEKAAAAAVAKEEMEIERAAAKAALSAKQDELDAWETKHAALIDELRQKHLQDIEATIVETRKENDVVMKEARSKYTEEAIVRQKLYNRVMELQGNIRVLCRIRPILKHELAKGAELAKDCTEFPVDNDIIIHPDEETAHRFEFDSTFGPDSTQEQVRNARMCNRCGNIGT